MSYAAPLGGTTHWVETVDATRLRSVVLGDGPRDVVLAHGYGFSADSWNMVAPALVAAGHRVIAFDQRGHGGSNVGADGVGSAQMASDYAAILDHHDVTDGVLVGHSMGGFVGINFLLNHPDVVTERLRGCMLMATFAGDVSRKNPQNRLQIPLIKSGILLRLISIPAIGKAFTRSLTGSYHQGMAEAFVPIFRSHDHSRLIPIMEAMTGESRYPDLAEIELPTTIVIGTKDRTTPPFHTEDMHARIEGSRLVRIEGKGHALNWEAPEVVAAEIALLSGAGA